VTSGLTGRAGCWSWQKSSRCRVQFTDGMVLHQRSGRSA